MESIYFSERRVGEKFIAEIVLALIFVVICFPVVFDKIHIAPAAYKMSRNNAGGLF